MPDQDLLRIKTISEFHTLRGLPKPKHPLISVVSFDDMAQTEPGQQNLIFDFYMISVQSDMAHKYRYGHKDYEFDEGVMFCMATHHTGL